MQIPGRDHQQRDMVNAVVTQPVADQRAALECRRLDVVQGHGDGAARAAHATRRPVWAPASATVPSTRW